MTMNSEIETLINNLEGCVGMFDYMLTPVENNLLLIYIRELEEENKKLHNKINKAIRYIKKNKHYIDIEDMNMYLYEDDINKVIEILKESDVDEY